MVLDTEDEPFQRDARRDRCREDPRVGGGLPRVEPALLERRRQVLDGTRKILIVALLIARERPPDFVMKIVRPDGVEGPSRPPAPANDIGQVPVVLGDQNDSAVSGTWPHSFVQFG